MRGAFDTPSPIEALSRLVPSILLATIGLLVVSGLGSPEARAVSPACSSTTPIETGFDDGGVHSTIAAPGEVDCFTIAGGQSGDHDLVGFESSERSGGAYPRWTVTAADGTQVCERSASGYNEFRSTCQLNSGGPWTLAISDANSTGTYSYRVAVRNLDDAEGCTPVEPNAWSFGGPRLDGSVSGEFGAGCFTFSRAAGEEDGAYWLRAIRTSGALDPRWFVYGPSGTADCQGTNNEPGNVCRLVAAGKYVAVVFDGSGTSSGNFYLGAKRLSAPSGCGLLPSIAFGSSASTGTIASAGAATCTTISGVSGDDNVSVGSVASGIANASPRWALVDGSGATVCDGYFGSSTPYRSGCRLTGTAPWRVISYDQAGTGSFSYSLAVRRLNQPEGCTPLGAPGAFSFTAPRLNGTISASLDARCYTFSRGPEEADGSFWFRAARTAGALSPEWTLYGPSGSRECSGYDAGPEQPCKISAAGQFAVVVRDSTGDDSGSFYLTSRQVDDPSGCSQAPSVSFGATPVSASISTAGEADCYSLPQVEAGDALSVALNGNAASGGSTRWALVDGDGATICRSAWMQANESCVLTGFGGWSLLVYTEPGTAGSTYSLAVRRLNQPEGCTPLGAPGAFSFTAPRLNGTISASLDARCYTFSRGPEEADGSFWFRSMRTSGNFEPRWTVFGPGGGRECTGAVPTPNYPCRLLAAGDYTLVVEDSNLSRTGGFLLAPKRLSDPAGCGSLPSIAFGASDISANLTTAGEADCYDLTASVGDELRFGLTGAADLSAVVDSDGDTVCLSYWSSVCRIQQDGSFHLLVFNSATGSGTYRLQVACENVPCGQTETAVADAVPNRIGQSRFTTVLLRGHDLDLLDKVTISRGGQEIQGEVQIPDPGGRAVEVRFDTSAAPSGNWTMAAHFLDGTTKLLPGGLTVEAARQGRVSLETVARETFRVGARSPLTVIVKNSGNIDAVGVPVVLSGLPSGAVIEPHFDSFTPEGESGSVEIGKDPYDQAAETITEGGHIYAPFLIARVPAERSVTMTFDITVPAAASYTLRVAAGQCWTRSGNTGTSTLATASAVGTQALLDSDEASCAGSIAAGAASIAADLSGVANYLPGGACVTGAADLAIQAAVAAHNNESIFSWRNSITWLIDGASCLGSIAIPISAPATGALKTAYRATEALSAADTAAGLIGDCMFLNAQSSIPQQAVFSMDPNEIRGPAGYGSEHYIQATGPLAYEVLFENLPSATAAAQKVRITDPLDGALLDPGSVTFTGFRFGGHELALPYPSASVEEVVDLRPEENLEIHITAGVEDGAVEVLFEAIDPETLEPPTDPSVGVVTPNDVPPEGEGAVLFSVAPRSLPAGSAITNAASIRFDENDPITTNTWSNTIDREPPTATVQAVAGDQPLTADVSWAGSDDAAGIGLWKIEVSHNGDPFEFWRAASAAGSDGFTATEPGSYSFRAEAFDGAGNVGSSPLAGVTLAAPKEELPDQTPPVQTPAVVSQQVVPAAPPAAKPPTLRCRKGFKKKKAKGKTRCVRKKKRSSRH